MSADHVGSTDDRNRLDRPLSAIPKLARYLYHGRYFRTSTRSVCWCNSKNWFRSLFNITRRSFMSSEGCDLIGMMVAGWWPEISSWLLACFLIVSEQIRGPPWGLRLSDLRSSFFARREPKSKPWFSSSSFFVAATARNAVWRRQRKKSSSEAIDRSPDRRPDLSKNVNPATPTFRNAGYCSNRIWLLLKLGPQWADISCKEDFCSTKPCRGPVFSLQNKRGVYLF